MAEPNKERRAHLYSGVKIVNVLAIGLMGGTSAYLLLTSFHVLPSSRSMAYGLFFGAVLVMARTTEWK